MRPTVSQSGCLSALNSGLIRKKFNTNNTKVTKITNLNKENNNRNGNLEIKKILIITVPVKI